MTQSRLLKNSGKIFTCCVAAANDALLLDMTAALGVVTSVMLGLRGECGRGVSLVSVCVCVCVCVCERERGRERGG